MAIRARLGPVESSHALHVESPTSDLDHTLQGDEATDGVHLGELVRAVVGVTVVVEGGRCHQEERVAHGHQVERGPPLVFLKLNDISFERAFVTALISCLAAFQSVFILLRGRRKQNKFS